MLRLKGHCAIFFLQIRKYSVCALKNNTQTQKNKNKQTNKQRKGDLG